MTDVDYAQKLIADGAGNLLNLLPLDNIYGAVDLSTVGQSGSAAGGLTIGASVPGPGEFGLSTDFDGVDDRVSTSWPSGRNWCTNPKAGTVATTNWSLVGTPTFTATNSLPTLTGLPSGITTGFRVQALNNADGVSFTWQADNGAGFTVSLYAYIAALNGASRIELADGGGSGTHTLVNDNVHERNTTIGSWVRMTMGFNATSTGTIIVKLREVTAASPACDWYFTGVQIERTVGGSQTAQTTYFDGDSSGGDVEWQGTANLSETGKGPYPQGSTRTFEGWANRDTNTTNDTLIGSAAANANNAVWLALKDANPEDVQYRAQAGGGKVTWTNAWPGEAQWVHWVMKTVIGTSAQLGINGVDKGSVALTDKTQGALAGNYSIGDYKAGTGDPFDGKKSMYAVYRGNLFTTCLGHYAEGLKVSGRRRQIVRPTAATMRAAVR